MKLACDGIGSARQPRARTAPDPAAGPKRPGRPCPLS